jgi:two-component system sensor histidine kinase/response regulator
MRLANQRALAHAGYDVIGSDDGEKGLEIANEKHPDLILLDMMLPKLSGPGVLKALKANPNTSSIPVIVLSALSDKNREKLMKEGAADFIEKSDALMAHNSAALIRTVAKIIPVKSPH